MATRAGAQEPPRIPGYVPPPPGDSLIKEGPLAGRWIQLECDPLLGQLETGDAVRCILKSVKTEGNISTFAHLDSFPDVRVANPNIIAPQRNGQLMARAPGFGQVWVSYGGAVARDFVTVGPSQGAVRFFPGVADTTIELGQSYKFRLVYYDSLNREQLDARQAAMALSWWGQPGRFDTVGLNLFEITPKEAGRVEVMMTRGRRIAKVTVHVVPAAPRPTPAPAPKIKFVPVLVRGMLASLQIQVIDAASSPRPIPIQIGSKVAMTGRDGWYRGRADTGTFTVSIRCPMTERYAGKVLRDTTLHFVARTNPRMRIRVSSAECALPAERSVRGTFTGHYRNDAEETFISCRSFAGDALSRTIVAIEAPGHVPVRLDDTTRYFARFEGTLFGPGAFGRGGEALYYLRVTGVQVMRPATPDDCTRPL